MELRFFSVTVQWWDGQLGSSKACTLTLVTTQPPQNETFIVPPHYSTQMCDQMLSCLIFYNNIFKLLSVKSPRFSLLFLHGNRLWSKTLLSQQRETQTTEAPSNKNEAKTRYKGTKPRTRKRKIQNRSLYDVYSYVLPWQVDRKNISVVSSFFTNSSDLASWVLLHYAKNGGELYEQN